MLSAFVLLVNLKSKFLLKRGELKRRKREQYIIINENSRYSAVYSCSISSLIKS